MKLLKEVEISGIEATDLHATSLETAKKIGAENIKEEIISNSPFSGKIFTSFSSIWGWGGMKIDISINARGSISILQLDGFIAQAWTGPLRKKMEKFSEELLNTVSQKYGQAVSFNPTNKNFSRKWTRSDSIMVIFVFIGVTVLALLEFFRISGGQFVTGIIVIPLIYYFVRRYHRRK